MKHNLSKHKGYSVWRQIRERCHNTSHKHYHNYGARGINLFDNWRTDVTSFINYVSNLPNDFKQGYSIDRINNNGNYEPNNCTWILKKDQAKNRRVRKSKISNSERQSKSIKQMAKEAGIPISTFRRKLIKERNFNVN